MFFGFADQGVHKFLDLLVEIEVGEMSQPLLTQQILFRYASPRIEVDLQLSHSRVLPQSQVVALFNGCSELIADECLAFGRVLQQVVREGFEEGLLVNLNKALIVLTPKLRIGCLEPFGELVEVDDDVMTDEYPRFTASHLFGVFSIECLFGDDLSESSYPLDGVFGDLLESAGSAERAFCIKGNYDLFITEFSKAGPRWYDAFSRNSADWASFTLLFQ